MYSLSRKQGQAVTSTTSVIGYHLGQPWQLCHISPWVKLSSLTENGRNSAYNMPPFMHVVP